MNNDSRILWKNQKPQDSSLSNGRRLDPLVPCDKQYRGKEFVFCVHNKIWVTEQDTRREENEIKLFCAQWAMFINFPTMTKNKTTPPNQGSIRQN